jgi:lysozyme family protein
MTGNFEPSLELVLKSESGFVVDDGGPTNLGVTKAVWEDYVGHPVTVQEIQNLTPLMVRPLYERLYWNKAKCNDLPSGLDYCVFDCAVNSGVGRSVRLLQRAVGADPDGNIGSITLALVRQTEPAQSINEFCDQRQRFIESLPAFATFGKGWTRRVKEVREVALRMAENG